MHKSHRRHDIRNNDIIELSTPEQLRSRRDFKFVVAVIKKR